MPEQFWAAEKSRRIVKRIIVEGDLVLHTPAHLGNGDGDEVVDLPLLVDAHDGKSPLLLGTSIAGALRSYLASFDRAASAALFGGEKGDDDGVQSPLIVEDARGDYAGVDRRDGVKLDAASRTAQDKALYDLHLWRAGTTFTLRFELVIHQDEDETRLKKALATALKGFNDSTAGITLGARKRRGYGRVAVSQWRVREFDLTQPTQLCRWIKTGGQALPIETAVDLSTLSADTFTDTRDVLVLDGAFALDGSLLIRSGGADDLGPDLVQLTAHQVGADKPKPIVSGTSLAGALRARALKIAKTIGPREKAEELIEGMFGADMQAVQKRRQAGDQTAKPRASRLSVEERMLTGGEAGLVQSRVSIDRFTGGARDTALFSEQPVWGEAAIQIKVRVDKPQDHEIGLLLLVLKDLWTGDLPLGGERSVGRGRLRGVSATLTRQTTWTITGNGSRVTVAAAEAEAMEACVQKLHTYLTGKEASHA